MDSGALALRLLSWFKHANDNFSDKSRDRQNWNFLSVNDWVTRIESYNQLAMCLAEFSENRERRNRPTSVVYLLLRLTPHEISIKSWQTERTFNCNHSVGFSSASCWLFSASHSQSAHKTSRRLRINPSEHFGLWFANIWARFMKFISLSLAPYH